MRPVAGGASLTHGFVFENEGATLGNVTLAASVLLYRKGGAATDDGLAFVRIVTIRASDSLTRSQSAAVRAFQHRMSVRQAEFAALIEVTLETCFGGAVRIDDGVCGTAGFFVDTPGPMAGFATNIDGVGARRFQFGMGGCREAAVNVSMALGTCLGAHKRSAWNFRWCNHGAIDRRAGKEHHGGNGRKDNSYRTPGKTPLGRCPRVRGVSAHKSLMTERTLPKPSEFRYTWIGKI